MVRAQQIERDGTPFGPVHDFPKRQWEHMKANYGKKLRWMIINEEPEEDGIQYPDYPELDDKEALMGKLENMTKRMIVSEYNLPKEDVRLNREELINKVVQKQ